MVACLSNLKTIHETITIIATEGYTTAQGRIYCVVQAMKQNCTHILFIDDDMTFPEDTLDRLLEHEKEIIGVNSHSRMLPISTTVSLLDESGNHMPPDQVPGWYKMPEELFEVYGIGMGVALIDMNIFGQIEKPWFKFDMHEDGLMIQGEDAWFCSQARNKGFKIWCDPTLEIGHIGNYTY